MMESKSKYLNESERKLVGRGFKALANPSDISKRVVDAVDRQEHIHYFKERKIVWDNIKTNSKEIAEMVQLAIDKYIDMYVSIMGRDKYSQLLSTWYSYVGTWAISELCSDQQGLLWQELTKNCTTVSAHDRSCIIHSMFDEIFSCFSNIIDAVQSKCFLASRCTTSTSPIIALCNPHDGMPDNDLSLYKVAGFSLHSCIQIRKVTVKSIAKRFKINTLRRAAHYNEQIKLLECLCCKDKAVVPVELQLLDRGGLTFPRKELLPFLREFSIKIKSYLNHNIYEDLGADTIMVLNIL